MQGIQPLGMWPSQIKETLYLFDTQNRSSYLCTGTLKTHVYTSRFPSFSPPFEKSLLQSRLSQSCLSTSQVLDGAVVLRFRELGTGWYCVCSSGTRSGTFISYIKVLQRAVFHNGQRAEPLGDSLLLNIK